MTRKAPLMRTRPSQVVGNSMRSSVACGVSLEVPNAWESRVDKHRIKIPDTVVEGFSGLIASLFCGRLQESVFNGPPGKSGPARQLSTYALSKGVLEESPPPNWMHTHQPPPLICLKNRQSHTSFNRSKRDGRNQRSESRHRSPAARTGHTV